MNAKRPEQAKSFPPVIQYINRDQIIAATVAANEITIITTLGQRIVIAASADRLSQLVEELVNSCGSNFVLCAVTTAEGDFI